MKIDLSTLILVTLCIIPGLFAQRSRNLVCPRSFVEQGASSELGELVALGISTHGLIVLFAALCLLFIGFCSGFHPLKFFHLLDTLDIQGWTSSHRSGATIVVTGYIFFSFAVSHWLGLLYGIWRKNSPLTVELTKLPPISRMLKRVGIDGILGEKPIIYEVLAPKRDADGTAYTVFIELEMRNLGGFYAGQLEQFAIVKDEEPHKPIYLVNVSFRRSLDDEYQSIEADGVMLDLADAAQIFVRQMPSGLETNLDSLPLTQLHQMSSDPEL